MSTSLLTARFARAHHRMYKWLTAYGARPHESTITAIVCDGHTYAPNEWRAQSKEG